MELLSDAIQLQTIPDQRVALGHLYTYVLLPVYLRSALIFQTTILNMLALITGCRQQKAHLVHVLGYIVSFLVVTLLLMGTPADAFAQAVGDSVVIQGGSLRDKPSTLATSQKDVEEGVGKVLEMKDDKLFGKSFGKWVRVSLSDREGWFYKYSVLDEYDEYKAEQRREARQDSIRRARRARQDSIEQAKQRARRQHIDNLQRQGFTLKLESYNLSTNSADGVSVYLRMTNISESKTIKYVDVSWRFYNSVGDPVTGQIKRRSTVETRLVGPIRPQQDASIEWENVLYSAVASCAEVRKIVVTHMDESTFTYINDLSDIGKRTDVPLAGDCSY